MIELNTITEKVFKSAQSGNRSSFRQVFETYKSLVYGVAYRLSNNETDAKDLTQQVFLKLLLKINSIKDGKALSGWLKRTCVNLYIDDFRKNRKFVDQNEKSEIVLDSIGNTITNLVENKIDLDMFLQQLKKEERLVTWLFSVEGYKHNEIAEKLNISLSNSKQILRRSLQKLTNLSKSYEK